jgi:hypothetical protein
MPNIRNLREGYAAANGGTVPAPAGAAALPPLLDVAGATGYALAALSKECALVMTAPEGTRNDTLNRAAYNMAQLVAGGQLPPALVLDELSNAARANGLPEVEITRTLASGLPAGEKTPRAAAPDLAAAWIGSLPLDRKEAPEWATSSTGHPESAAATQPTPDTANQTTPTPVAATGATTAPDVLTDASATSSGSTPTATSGDGLPPEMFNRDVALELHRLNVRDTAARIAKAQANSGAGRPQMYPLPAFLAIEDEDVSYRMMELWPTGGRIIFTAQYKTGKSTAVGNALRALADGDPFLDQFTTAPAGRIVLIDNELDPRTLRRWLRDQGIQNTAAITLIPLRGKVSAFDIMDPETRGQWAPAMACAHWLILDCLRPVLDALGLSEDKDAGRFLVAFDALLDQCGAQEALVVHHMGHGGERSRGDSRILDWPDATWRMIRDSTEDPTSARYFSAFGRDVDVAESMLIYNPDTRHLSITGGTRSQTRQQSRIEKIIEFVRLNPGTNKTGIQNVGGNKELNMDALEAAVRDGFIVQRPAVGARGYTYFVE